MKSQYLTLFILLSLAAISSGSLDIKGGLLDTVGNLKGLGKNLLETLKATKGKWMENKDELFKKAVSELKIDFKDSKDREARKGIFEKNLAKAQELTEKHDGHALFGINSLSFMTFDEYKSDVLMNPIPLDDIPTGNDTFSMRRKKRYANFVDLRQRGAVGPVRNQQQCGACWSFAAVATIETMFYRKYAQLNDFSEEQFVDCNLNNNGCNGGWIDRAYEYAKSYGVAHEYYYPYQGARTTCYAPGGWKVKVASWGQLSKYDTTSMVNLIDQGYAIAVVIKAGIPEIQSYTYGVLVDPTDCTGTTIDHAVTIVGYNLQNNPPYWIVRNSWGTGWGYQGYFYVKIGINYCHIEEYPYYVYDVYHV